MGTRLRKMVFISPYEPQHNGVAVFCALLAQELSHLLHVVVLAQDEDWIEPKSMSSQDLSIRRIWKRGSALYPLRLFKETVKEKPEIADIQFEAFGTFGPFDFFTIPWLLVLLRLIHVEIVVTLHSFVDCPASRKIETDYLESGGLGRFVKYVYSVLHVPLYQLLKVMRISIIVQTVQSKKRLQHTLGLCDDSVKIVPFGSPVGEGKIAPTSRKKSGRLVLVFGFIRPGKNIEDVIRAIPIVRTSIPDCRLLIAGEPTDEKYLEFIKELAQQENGVDVIDRYLTNAEVSSAFVNADVVVLPYVMKSGSSGVLRFALAFGKPIVCVTEGTLGEEAVGEAGGLFYKSGDVMQLASCLTNILTDDELYQTLSAKSFAAAQTLSSGSAARRIEEIYEECVARRRILSA